MKAAPVVLLAEDDLLVRNLISLVLKGAAYSVLIACDGVEALELSRHYKGRIHLLLSDVTMPNMDGVTLAAKIRIERPDTLTLLISGETSSEIVRASGLFEFMRKPFRPAHLRERIERMLQEVSADDLSSSGRISSAAGE